MFGGFPAQRVVANGCAIDLLVAGEGPPLLLLHGFPQTRAAWHCVAPALARRFTVVVPDLPGYGRSGAPPVLPGHMGQAKRTSAATLRLVMEKLGFARFHVAGHDRGGRIAYRMALDAPGSVDRLVILDIMTTLQTWEEMRWQGALRAYHWAFLATPAPLPETMIGHDPGFYLDHLLARWAGGARALDAGAVADYRAAIANPSVIAQMCEDYRAGAGPDVEIDRADRDAGQRIGSPLLVLRGSRYEPRELAPFWRVWADQVEEVVFDCGHFIAEEEPEGCIAAMEAFLCR
jgi:haloacetate dehalogenase